jgi:hypothetical protein
MTEDIMEELVEHHRPHFPETSLGNFTVVMDHDTGPCLTLSFDPANMVDFGHKAPFRGGVHAVTHMGDYWLRCLRAHDITVIPPVSRVRKELHDAWGSLAKVKPVHERSVFISFKASHYNVLRKRLVDHTFFKKVPKDQVFLDRFPKNRDYISTIGDSRFCIHARGTVGWSFRLADIIYAGCIPVLIVDATMHPFENFLDYRKFSVRVPEDQVYRLEEILLSYSENDLKLMQAHLIRMRSAFWYGTNATIESLYEFDGINPMRLVMANLYRRQMTMYPIRE